LRAEAAARGVTIVQSQLYNRTDADASAALLSRDRGSQGFSRGALENREGFAGSDGLFRFNTNGAIERGLAIIEVRPTEVTVLDAAPRRFPESGT
jgi:hypothetical protein